MTSRQETLISPITDVIAELRAGRMVVLVDEEDRENEGDLLIAAEFATPEVINFMVRHARGLVCLTLSGEKCRSLNLPQMAAVNRASHGTNFTVSIEAAQGVTTGISAGDRARTVQVAIRPDASPADLVQPGHIFPLMAADGGVLVRAGHTEAGCDLARLAGLTPAAVICEILKDNGEMARLPDLVEFAAQHHLKIGTIVDLIHYRSSTESLVKRVAERDIETTHGTLRLHVYSDRIGDATHLALVKGRPAPRQEVLVRVHEPLSVIDLIDVASHSHSWNFNDALAAIARAECGVIVLLHRAETAADLLERARVHEEGMRAGGVVLRNYGIGAQILRDLGVRRMQIMGMPRPMPSMAGFDLEVTGYVQPGAERNDNHSAEGSKPRRETK
ncbi:MAG: bifunctional 3,4-dihydroxy-2-butanone-4-phosphate synthase/GTP cyclohydrolase II [Betaproteobacteria bacterium]|nr:bifunctional 3,4-dihydroxy-2-butanone-4-phosphate synthase/GTP cyclohydrolase II [Betaproteobacteria bacterium]MDH3437656.1 bifunctional 3,4-dihydroxy-2-butanone-4-phosphate synthase/GTP cyclohydrolase II [Betaproteobacteria bacterium]